MKYYYFKILFILILSAHNGQALNIIEEEECNKLTFEERFYDLKYVMFCEDYMNLEHQFLYIEKIENKDLLNIWLNYPHTIDVLDLTIEYYLQVLKIHPQDQEFLDIPIPKYVRAFHNAYIKYRRLKNEYQKGIIND